MMATVGVSYLSGKFLLTCYIHVHTWPYESIGPCVFWWAANPHFRELLGSQNEAINSIDPKLSAMVGLYWSRRPRPISTLPYYQVVFQEVSPMLEILPLSSTTGYTRWSRVFGGHELKWVFYHSSGRRVFSSIWKTLAWTWSLWPVGCFIGKQLCGPSRNVFKLERPAQQGTACLFCSHHR